MFDRFWCQIRIWGGQTDEKLWCYSGNRRWWLSPVVHVIKPEDDRALEELGIHVCESLSLHLFASIVCSQLRYPIIIGQLQHHLALVMIISEEILRSFTQTSRCVSTICYCVLGAVYSILALGLRDVTTNVLYKALCVLSFVGLFFFIGNFYFWPIYDIHSFRVMRNAF